jgi:hypothetical protein
MRKLDLYMHLPPFDNKITEKQIVMLRQQALEHLS